MTINEAQRLEMHLGLRNALGDDVAGTLMAHLPPGGWSEVAQVRDVAHLRDRMDERFASVQSRMDERFAGVQSRMDDKFARLQSRMDSGFSGVDIRVERDLKRFDGRLNAIVTGLWTVGTVFAGAFVALFTLIVTKF